ncbi:tetratricopeptide repeat protein [Trichloromonas sp.]|uniref:tetratricopeptide repeat protein n=1 Tax=Trichloromonas sp. TaxID=3069249 RepID=UPI003D815AD9
MAADELDLLVAQGLTAIEQENTLLAMMHFENAARIRRTPTVLSCLGFCIAKEHGQLQKASSLCLEAIHQEPNVPLHYLNLARVQRLAGHRLRAIKILQMGLKQPGNQQIVAELKQLGIRKPPLFVQLSRDHPLNKLGGKFFARLGLR